MNFLPIYYEIKNKPCLVVGGGKVASRKIRLLLSAGASVTLVSPQNCDEISGMVNENKIVWQQRDFSETDINGQALIIASTNNEQVNLAIAELAQQHNIPCNLVDNPDKGSFIMPSIIDRSPVIVAVSRRYLHG